MTDTLEHLFENNRKWSESIREDDPHFFTTLSRQQAPEYLWIGCSDSRVPANDIVGLLPGELFVHRNVANVVVHTDLNCLSVMQYAVDVLRVKHIMVVGHYGCGGVRAAITPNLCLGLIDNWLRHIQDVSAKHEELLSRYQGEAQVDKLCELNVLEQVINVSRTTVARDAWARGQPLTLHGWVYSLADGIARDLGCSIDAPEGVDAAYRETLRKL